MPRPSRPPWRSFPPPIPRDPPSVYRQVALAKDLLLGPGTHSAHYFDRAQLTDFPDRRHAFEDISLIGTLTASRRKSS